LPMFHQGRLTHYSNIPTYRGGFPRPVSSFPAFKKTVGRFRGIDPGFFFYQFFHCRGALGELKRPFFCLPTHFLPLSDPFSTAFRPIFFRFLAHFLPVSDPLSTPCRPSFYFSRAIFLAPGISFLQPRANKRLRRGQEWKINFPALFNSLL